ncbi:MAG: D-aminoacylase [Fimbriimonadales bacterium]|nr:D-aminoacylase [Fimbriimonadales bacterium]
MPNQQRCDILLRGGTVFDGLGNAGFHADVAITDDKIVAVGALEGWQAGMEVDVGGLCVAPGFIDIHTHADFSLNHHPEQMSVLFQGVTTQVGGNCGFAVGQIDDSPLFRQEQRWLKPHGVEITWGSFREYLRILDDLGLGVNYVPQCGHGTARKKVMGYEKRAPTSAELDAMRHEIALCFEAGAFAFTTGLEYPPNSFAHTSEIIELAKVAAQYGGFYATHLRSEGDQLIESVQEALQIAEQAALPLQLAHHKAEGRRNWGKVQQTLQMVSDAVAQGLDVTLDVYPYTAYQTSLAVASLPSWALEGDPEVLLSRLRDPHERERLIHAMQAMQPDWHSTVIGSTPHNRAYQGLTIADAARLAGKEPEAFVLDLLLDAGGHVGVAWFNMAEDDLRAVLKHPRTMIGSDGVGTEPSKYAAERPHPRSYGTFPRVLAKYVRAEGLLSLEEAIFKMTGLPAARLKLTDRGVLRPGAYADIVVFDFAKVQDLADFENPHRLAQGVVHLLVNGRWAIHDGAYTGTRAGRVLRRQ